MKNITHKICIASLILLSFIVWSCKEDPTGMLNNDVTNKSLNSSYTINNPINPYDSAGVIHNESMEYLLDNREYFGNNIDSMCTEIVSLLGDYFEVRNPSNVSNPSTYYRDSIYNFLFNQRNKSLSQLYAVGGYSQLAIDMNDSILTLAGYHAQNGNNLGAFINEIKLLETEILTENNLNTNEKKWLLSQTSILRYSSVFWNNKIQENGGDTDHDFDFIPFGFFDWFEDAFNDVVDYISNNPWKALGIATVDAATLYGGGSIWGAAAGSAITWYGLEQI